jgi:hypothetical protein
MRCNVVEERVGYNTDLNPASDGTAINNCPIDRDCYQISRHCGVFQVVQPLSPTASTLRANYFTSPSSSLFVSNMAKSLTEAPC